MRNDCTIDKGMILLGELKVCNTGPMRNDCSINTGILLKYYDWVS